MNDQSPRTNHRVMPACLGRRRFLILGGTAVTVLATIRGGASALGQAPQLVMSVYPEKKVASLSALRPRTPVEFTYPNDDVRNVLVMLGERAGGGVGPNQDIVAFNTVCTHMGGPVGAETYKSEHNVLGPCPLHYTTFDLTKHGMVVSGHATESLPQIALDLRGDDIYAVGVMGLMYGYSVNPAGT